MNKVKNVDLIYCIAFALFVISRILSHTTYEISTNIKHIMTLVSVLIVVIKTILYDKLTLKEIFIYGLTLMVAVISTTKSKEYEMLCSIIFIVGAKNVSFDSIAKSYRIVASTLMVITIFLSIVGFLKENLFYRGEVLRHTFGYLYPTDFVAMTFYILLVDCFLCLKYKKNLMPRIIIYVIVAILTLILCDSRLGSLFIALLIPVSLIIKYSKKWKTIPAVIFFEKYSLIICAMISVILVSLYIKYPSSNVIYALDSFLSFRLALTVWAVKMFGYPLLGRDIYSEFFSTKNTLWFFIDNSYYVMFIQYGMLISFIILTLFTFNNKKQLEKNNDIIPVMFSLIALNSMVGQQLFLLEYNIFLLTLRADTRCINEGEK